MSQRQRMTESREVKKLEGNQQRRVNGKVDSKSTHNPKKKDVKLSHMWEAARRKKFNDELDTLLFELPNPEPCPKVAIVRQAISFIRECKNSEHAEDKLKCARKSINELKEEMKKLEKRYLILTLVIREAGIIIEVNRKTKEIAFTLPVMCLGSSCNELLKKRKVFFDLTTMDVHENDFEPSSDNPISYNKITTEKETQTELMKTLCVGQDFNYEGPLVGSPLAEKTSVPSSDSYIPLEADHDYPYDECHSYDGINPLSQWILPHKGNFMQLETQDSAQGLIAGEPSKMHKDQLYVEEGERNGIVAIKIFADDAKLPANLNQESISNLTNYERDQDLQETHPGDNCGLIQGVAGNRPSAPGLLALPKYPNLQDGTPDSSMLQNGPLLLCPPTICKSTESLQSSTTHGKKILIIRPSCPTPQAKMRNIQILPPLPEGNLTISTPSLSSTPIMSTGMNIVHLNKGKFVHLNSNPLVCFPVSAPKVAPKLKRIAPKPVLSSSSIVSSSSSSPEFPANRKRQCHFETPPIQVKRAKVSPTFKNSAISSNSESATNENAFLTNSTVNNLSALPSEENEVDDLRDLSTSTFTNLVSGSSIMDDEPLGNIIDLPCVMQESIGSSNLAEGVAEDKLVEMLYSFVGDERSNFMPTSLPTLVTDAVKAQKKLVTHSSSSMPLIKPLGFNTSPMKKPATLLFNDRKAEVASTTTACSSPSSTKSVGGSNYSINSLCISSKKVNLSTCEKSQIADTEDSQLLSLPALSSLVTCTISSCITTSTFTPTTCIASHSKQDSTIISNLNAETTSESTSESCVTTQLNTKTTVTSSSPLKIPSSSQPSSFLAKTVTCIPNKVIPCTSDAPPTGKINALSSATTSVTSNLPCTSSIISIPAIGSNANSIPISSINNSLTSSVASHTSVSASQGVLPPNTSKYINDIATSSIAESSSTLTSSAESSITVASPTVATSTSNSKLWGHKSPYVIESLSTTTYNSTKETTPSFNDSNSKATISFTSSVSNTAVKTTFSDNSNSSINNTSINYINSPNIYISSSGDTKLITSIPKATETVVTSALSIACSSSTNEKIKGRSGIPSPPKSLDICIPGFSSGKPSSASTCDQSTTPLVNSSTSTSCTAKKLPSLKSTVAASLSDASKHIPPPACLIESSLVAISCIGSTPPSSTVSQSSLHMLPHKIFLPSPFPSPIHPIRLPPLSLSSLVTSNHAPVYSFALAKTPSSFTLSLSDIATSASSCKGPKPSKKDNCNTPKEDFSFSFIPPLSSSSVPLSIPSSLSFSLPLPPRSSSSSLAHPLPFSLPSTLPTLSLTSSSSVLLPVPNPLLSLPSSAPLELYSIPVPSSPCTVPFMSSSNAASTTLPSALVLPSLPSHASSSSLSASPSLYSNSKSLSSLASSLPSVITTSSIPSTSASLLPSFSVASTSAPVDSGNSSLATPFLHSKVKISSVCLTSTPLKLSVSVNSNACSSFSTPLTSTVPLSLSFAPSQPLNSSLSHSTSCSLTNSVFSLAPISSYTPPFPFCGLPLSDAPTTFSFTLTQSPVSFSSTSLASVPMQTVSSDSPLSKSSVSKSKSEKDVPYPVYRETPCLSLSNTFSPCNLTLVSSSSKAVQFSNSISASPAALSIESQSASNSLSNPQSSAASIVLTPANTTTSVNPIHSLACTTFPSLSCPDVSTSCDLDLLPEVSFADVALQFKHVKSSSSDVGALCPGSTSSKLPSANLNVTLSQSLNFDSIVGTPRTSSLSLVTPQSLSGGPSKRIAEFRVPLLPLSSYVNNSDKDGLPNFTDNTTPASAHCVASSNVTKVVGNAYKGGENPKSCEDTQALYQHVDSSINEKSNSKIVLSSKSEVRITGDATVKGTTSLSGVNKPSDISESAQSFKTKDKAADPPVTSVALTKTASDKEYTGTPAKQSLTNDKSLSKDVNIPTNSKNSDKPVSSSSSSESKNGIHDAVVEKTYEKKLASSTTKDFKVNPSKSSPSEKTMAKNVYTSNSASDYSSIIDLALETSAKESFFDIPFKTDIMSSMIRQTDTTSWKDDIHSANFLAKGNQCQRTASTENLTPDTRREYLENSYSKPPDENLKKDDPSSGPCVSLEDKEQRNVLNQKKEATARREKWTTHTVIPQSTVSLIVEELSSKTDFYSSKESLMPSSKASKVDSKEQSNPSTNFSKNPNDDKINSLDSKPAIDACNDKSLTAQSNSKSLEPPTSILSKSQSSGEAKAGEKKNDYSNHSSSAKENPEVSGIQQSNHVPFISTSQVNLESNDFGKPKFANSRNPPESYEAAEKSMTCSIPNIEDGSSTQNNLNKSTSQKNSIHCQAVQDQLFVDQPSMKDEQAFPQIGVVSNPKQQNNPSSMRHNPVKNFPGYQSNTMNPDQLKMQSCNLSPNVASFASPTSSDQTTYNHGHVQSYHPPMQHAQKSLNNNSMSTMPPMSQNVPNNVNLTGQLQQANNGRTPQHNLAGQHYLQQGQKQPLMQQNVHQQPHQMQQQTAPQTHQQPQQKQISGNKQKQNPQQSSQLAPPQQMMQQQQQQIIQQHQHQLVQPQQLIMHQHQQQQGIPQHQMQTYGTLNSPERNSLKVLPNPQLNHSPMDGSCLTSFDYNPCYRKQAHSPRSEGRISCHTGYKNFSNYLPDDDIESDHAVVTGPFIEDSDPLNMRGVGEGSSDHVRYFSVSHLVSQSNQANDTRKGSSSNSIMHKDQTTVTNEDKTKDLSKTKSSNRKQESKSRSSGSSTSKNSQSGDSRRRSPARSIPGQQQNNLIGTWNGKLSNAQKQTHNYSAEALLSFQNYGRPPRQAVNQNYHFMAANQMYQTPYSPHQMKNFVQNSSFGYPSHHDRSGHGACNADYNFQLHPQASGSFAYGSNPYMAPSYHYQNLPPTSISSDIMAPHPSGTYPRFHDIGTDQTNFSANASFPLFDPQDVCGGPGLVGAAAPSMAVRMPPDPSFGISSSSGIYYKNPKCSIPSGVPANNIGAINKRSRYNDANMVGSSITTPTNFLEGGALAAISLHSFTPPCEDPSFVHTNLLGGSSRHQSNFFLGSDNFMPLNTPGQYPNGNNVGSSSNSSVSANSMHAPIGMGATAGASSPRNSSLGHMPQIQGQMPHNATAKMMDRQVNMATPSAPHLSSSLSNFNLTSIIPEIDGKNEDDGPTITPSIDGRDVTASISNEQPPLEAMSSLLPISKSSTSLPQQHPASNEVPSSINNSMGNLFGHPHQVGLSLNVSLPLATSFSSMSFPPTET